MKVAAFIKQMTVLGLVKLLVGLFLIAILAFFAAIILSIEYAPSISEVPPLSSARAQQASGFVKRISRQVVHADGNVVTLSASNDEINSTFDLITATYPGVKGRINIADNNAHLVVSMRRYIMSKPVYINAEATLVPSSKGLDWKSVWVGNLPLATGLSKYLFRRTTGAVLGEDFADRLLLGVGKISITEQTIEGSFQPPENLQQGFADAAQNMRKQSGQQVELNSERIVYYMLVLDQLRQVQQKNSLPLTVALRRLMIAAKDQSLSLGLQPQNENISAQLALAIHIGPSTFRHFIPNLADRHVKKTSPLKLTLGGRQDLAKHFIYSMAIQILSEKGLSISLGETKEIMDANHNGSGFSFADIAADRAGIKFAEVAISNAENARLLQEYSEVSLTERDIFPLLDGLPEGLSEESFKQRFGSIDSPAYHQLISEIDRRLQAIPLLTIADESNHEGYTEK